MGTIHIWLISHVPDIIMCMPTPIPQLYLPCPPLPPPTPPKPLVAQLLLPFLHAFSALASMDDPSHVDAPSTPQVPLCICLYCQADGEAAHARARQTPHRRCLAPCRSTRVCRLPSTASLGLAGATSALPGLGLGPKDRTEAAHHELQPLASMPRPSWQIASQPSPSSESASPV